MTFLEKYANVILTSLNLQKGQNLLIRTEPVHWNFASIIAAEAGKPFRAPTEILAGKIMEIPPSPTTIDKLWEVLIPILHLDEKDPSTAWVKNGKTLKRRASALNNFMFKEVYFKGTGTSQKHSLNITENTTRIRYNNTKE